MPSAAHSTLIAAVAEVTELGRAYPMGKGSIFASKPLTRVIGRASTVLLSSHFERYFYAINEEAAQFINTCGLSGDRLPEALRLVHTRDAMNAIEKVSWERRASHLGDFVRTDAWLWIGGSVGTLEHERILSWMKSPKPESLIRFYRYWGINDIFGAVTRKPQTRARLFLLVRELVDKRNNIAHGDFTALASRSDVLRYSATVTNFCSRADSVLARALARLTGSTRPW